MRMTPERVRGESTHEVLRNRDSDHPRNPDFVLNLMTTIIKTLGTAERRAFLNL